MRQLVPCWRSLSKCGCGVVASLVPLRRVAGRFWRAIATDRAEDVLEPPGPGSAGRYHRPGQPALYITPEADWAVIAIGRYLLADGIERAVVPLELDLAKVLDQRDPAPVRRWRSIRKPPKCAGTMNSRLGASHRHGSPPMPRAQPGRMESSMCRVGSPAAGMSVCSDGTRWARRSCAWRVIRSLAIIGPRAIAGQHLQVGLFPRTLPGARVVAELQGHRPMRYEVTGITEVPE